MRLSKRKKLRILSLVISIILLIIIFLNTFLIVKYNVLPIKYLIIYLVLVVLTPALIILISFLKKRKGLLQIILNFIKIIYIIILIIVFIYLANTFGLLNKVTGKFNYETKTYYVVVDSTSSYDDIDDLINHTIGYNNLLDTSASDALNELKETVNVNRSEYESFSDLFSDLEIEDIDAVLILDSFYDILTEDDTELENSVNIIYTFTIKEEIDDIQKDVDVTSEVFNVYISGIDSYGSVTSNTRSDVNIIASINPTTHEVLLINIPRDYYVKLSGIGKYDKLTHAGVYGIETSIATIEDLLDIEINYYVKVNYSALVKLIDALDGVNVYSKYSFYSTFEHYYFSEGYNYVNGDQALEFVRTRKAFADGDRVRGENQQAMIEAIIAKMNSATILLKYNELLTSLDGTFATNLSTSQIVSLVNKQLDEMASWTVTSISLNGTDSYEYTYSYPAQELYVMIPSEDSINEVKEILQEFLNN